MNVEAKHDSKQGAVRHLPVARGRERNAPRHESPKADRTSESRLQAAVARTGSDKDPYANVPCTD